MLHLYEPLVENDQWTKACKLWDKKILRLDDEKLLYIRERINYELEKRSERYLDEMINNLKKEKRNK